jgi:hypothetical protein
MTRLPLLLVCFAFTALADVPPADSQGCQSKSVGDSCKRDDGSAGTCVTSTCSRNDYSGGMPPKRAQYECVKCGAATATPAPAPTPEPAPPTTNTVSSPPAEPDKKNTCAAMPGESLAALSLVLLGLRRSRRA